LIASEQESGSTAPRRQTGNPKGSANVANETEDRVKIAFSDKFPDAWIT
jgi:hypothetical protein